MKATPWSFAGVLLLLLLLAACGPVILATSSALRTLPGAAYSMESSQP